MGHATGARGSQRQARRAKVKARAEAGGRPLGHARGTRKYRGRGRRGDCQDTRHACANTHHACCALDTTRAAHCKRNAAH
eukprot:15450509-Alexandrium_andersonii.AAC.1